MKRSTTGPGGGGAVPPSGAPPDQRLSALLERLRPPPSRFVYISTTGVYGDRGGAWIDETAERRPATARGAARVAAGRGTARGHA